MNVGSAVEEDIPVEPLARTERAALVETLLATDPDGPTMCEGWSARDLAAHVVVRERHVLGALGIFLPPLAGYGDRVRCACAERPYEEIVALIASGPPRLSPYAIPALDRGANGIEFFVHHEDVRRGTGRWEPRTLSPAADDELWARLRGRSRLALRSAPCGVVLRRPDGATTKARSGEPLMTVTGPPAELVLFAFGRQRHAQVAIDGDPAMARRLRAASFRV